VPQVSVIIPAYNGRAYIAQAIESVLGQSYTDLELLVVDDGSTDDTAAIIQSYGARLRYFCKTNGGPGSARNAGIRHAQGEYIAFLDQDDLWLPNRLAEQVPMLQHDAQLGLVFSDALYQTTANQQEHHSFAIDRPFSGHAFAQLFTNNFIPNLTVLVRKSCFDRLGLLDESGTMMITDDYNMWLRVAAHYPIAFVDKPLARYRWHEQNFSADRERALIDTMTALQDVLQRHPHLKKELGKRVGRRFADLYYRLSRHYFSIQNYSAAHDAAIQAWNLDRLHWKNAAFMLYSGIQHLIATVRQSITMPQ
jgi:glycosyltransferase involved in cell wall biosynthesis